jgi:hypothetical protein
MTRSTDLRQLRLLVSGVLSHYKVDNLEMEIKLCEAVKRFFADNGEPAHARERILTDIFGALQAGTAEHERLEVMQGEIERRVHINPTGMMWLDFLKWAIRKEDKEGQKLSVFLDWWLSDEWQATHPPTRPDSWLVKWPQAFQKKAAIDTKQEEGGGLYV